MSEHHSSRRAKRLKQDAGRSQKLRDKNKEMGTPTTHQINRALVEGFFYQVAAHRKAGTEFEEIRISPFIAFQYARRILSANTNASDSYEEDEVIRVLKERLHRECSTSFRFDWLPEVHREPDNDGDDNTEET